MALCVCEAIVSHCSASVHVTLCAFCLICLCHSKPAPGSEHVSPVSSTAAYPPGEDAAAAAAAEEGLPATDADDDTAVDMMAEPAVAVSEMDAEKELLPADVVNEIDSVEQQPATDKQGRLFHFVSFIINNKGPFGLL